MTGFFVGFGNGARYLLAMHSISRKRDHDTDPLHTFRGVLLLNHRGNRATKKNFEVYQLSPSRMNFIFQRGNRLFRFLCVCCLCFFAGMVFQAHGRHAVSVEAASDHLYELMVYHALPGKAPALESIFQDVSKLQAKHGLRVLGYWVPKENSPAWKDTFVYLVVHSNRQSAEANWNALHADPAFRPYRDAAIPLIQQKEWEFQVDEVYMSPTSYSQAK